MTYCVAIRTDAGLCFISDSRTNAGVDNVSTYSKMYVYDQPGERQLTVLSSGNLATTQGVINQIKRDTQNSEVASFASLDTLDDIADYVGECSLEQQEKHTGGGKPFEASFIVFYFGMVPRLITRAQSWRHGMASLPRESTHTRSTS